MGKAQLELTDEVVGRQESLDAMLLFAVRADDQNRRRPLHTVLSAQPLPLVAILADMDAYGNESLGDEVFDATVGIHLGIQPSTTVSHRGGAEVEEHRCALELCVL